MMGSITHLGAYMAGPIQRQASLCENKLLFNVQPSVLCCNISSQVYTA